MMVVNSLNFWLFFIIVLLFYYGFFHKSARWQNISLLVASYVFYGMVDMKMCSLLFTTTVVFYLLGLAIGEYKNKNLSVSSSLTMLGVCMGVGLLVYFKYLNFFTEQFGSFLSTLGLNINWNTFNIIMPLGISFYTFKLISYVIEVYRGNMTPTKDYVAFGTFIAFFPTIMSGPIDNPIKFEPQLRSARTVNYDDLTEAGRHIVWGLFLKVCIADNLSSYTSAVLDNYSQHNATSIIFAAVFYSFQLYCDFAGYSEMAIGVSRILGIKVMENFCRPYFAQSVTEFWKRWHISLTRWLTQYVYISLGGNRCSNLKQYRNIMVTFIVSGIWHGANWTFILWGVFHGVFQTIEKILGLNVYLKKPARNVSTNKESVTRITYISQSGGGANSS